MGCGGSKKAADVATSQQLQAPPPADEDEVREAEEPADEAVEKQPAPSTKLAEAKKPKSPPPAADKPVADALKGSVFFVVQFTLSDVKLLTKKEWVQTCAKQGLQLQSSFITSGGEPGQVFSIWEAKEGTDVETVKNTLAPSIRWGSIASAFKVDPMKGPFGLPKSQAAPADGSRRGNAYFMVKYELSDVSAFWSNFGEIIGGTDDAGVAYKHACSDAGLHQHAFYPTADPAVAYALWEAASEGDEAAESLEQVVRAHVVKDGVGAFFAYAVNMKEKDGLIGLPDSDFTPSE